MSFCDETHPCPEHSENTVRCYLTRRQHRNGHHKALCTSRHGAEEPIVHWPEWPIEEDN